jgi:hypothetical protein
MDKTTCVFAVEMYLFFRRIAQYNTIYVYLPSTQHEKLYL